MKLRLLVPLFMLAFSLGCISLRAQSDINLSGYTQTFDDEFNSLSVSTSNPKDHRLGSIGLLMVAARNVAMKQWVSTWAESDTNQVAQWLKELPQAPSRDFAVDAFSGAVTSSSPNAAFVWAETISDPTLRDDRLQSVVKSWSQSDATAAEQQITQSNLPADLKKQLLSGTNL